MTIISHFSSFTSNRILVLLLSSCLIFTTSCTNYIQRTTSTPAEIKDASTYKKNPFLKLHMKNGELYVLSDWKIKDKNELIGTGKHLNFNREVINEGDFNIDLQNIVIAESNDVNIVSSGTALLTAVTIITGVFTVYCISNPKACFGSCPTFYTGSGDNEIVQAEGFSSSVSPSLEKRDIDALYRVSLKSRNLGIQLKNEAYETHVIRTANVLAVPRPEGGRVFAASDGNFYQAKNLYSAEMVVASEGDCSEKLCEFDRKERFSPADSNDLNEKEIIEITFSGNGSENIGMVIASRQTLLTTFLFYQTLSYMGANAGACFSEIERNSSLYKTILENPLGNIDVLFQKKNGEWEKICEIGEHGPIATDIKIVPLKEIISREHQPDQSEYKIRLRMAKGLWRIDYVAFAELGSKVEPLVIKPSASFPANDLSGRNVVSLLNSPDSLLITFPGDVYSLSYILPSDFQGYELFMESQGYYLEWMRDEWIADQNSAKLYKLLMSPVDYFKEIAPEFKSIEGEMEETFWSSKYVYK